MSLRIAPITLDTANDFVRRLHRHNGPLPGARFAVGCEAKTRQLNGPEWVLCGVAIVGYPSAPALQDGLLAEIRRVCTDGTPNACFDTPAATAIALRGVLANHNVQDIEA